MLSADYKTAQKLKSIYNVFLELNQSHWVTEANPCHKQKKFVTKTLQDLSQKYEAGPVFVKPPPQPAQGLSKKRTSKRVTDDDDEQCSPDVKQ